MAKEPQNEPPTTPAPSTPEAHRPRSSDAPQPGPADPSSNPGPSPNPSPNPSPIESETEQKEQAEGAAEEHVPAGASELSDRDRAVLAFARRTWHLSGAKERAIREQLELSPTRYYQVLNTLIDRPEALAHDPVTVNRLRRMRQARRSRR